MTVIFLGDRHELIAQTQIQCERRSHLPVVLEVTAELFLAPIEDLDGLVRLSTSQRESRRQIGFYLLRIASQKRMEGIELINAVVAAVDLIHDEAHRIELASDLKRVFGSGNRQVVSIRVVILKK